MNTSKRKSTGFFVPQEHISTRLKSTSLDQRRVNVHSEGIRARRADDDTSTQDLRTLQAVDDIGSFSYMLGDELPIFPDEDLDNLASEDGAIHVTMKAKRSENSVSHCNDVEETWLMNHDCNLGFSSCGLDTSSR